MSADTRKKQLDTLPGAGRAFSQKSGGQIN